MSVKGAYRTLKAGIGATPGLSMKVASVVMLSVAPIVLHSSFTVPTDEMNWAYELLLHAAPAMAVISMGFIVLEVYVDGAMVLAASEHEDEAARHGKGRSGV